LLLLSLLLLSLLDPLFERLDFDFEVLVLLDSSLLVFVELGLVVTRVVGVVRIGVRTGATLCTVGGGLLVVGATEGAATGGGGGAAGNCEDAELNSDAGVGGGT
jgi:hypothetical protein